MKNWKTTAAAIVGIAVLAGSKFGISEEEIRQWGELIGMLIVGLGLVAAKDEDGKAEG